MLAFCCLQSSAQFMAFFRRGTLIHKQLCSHLRTISCTIELHNLSSVYTLSSHYHSVLCCTAVLICFVSLLNNFVVTYRRYHALLNSQFELRMFTCLHHIITVWFVFVLYCSVLCLSHPGVWFGLCKNLTNMTSIGPDKKSQPAYSTEEPSYSLTLSKLQPAFPRENQTAFS